MVSLFNFEDNKEYITIDLPNKKGNIVKLAGTTEDPYFCGKDVCDILQYENVQKALFKHVDKDDKIQLSRLEEFSQSHKNHLGKYHEKLSYNDGKAIYISIKGLKSLLQKSRNGTTDAKNAIIERLNLDLNLIFSNKEWETLSSIERALASVLYKNQYVVGPYRIDLYLPKFKIAIECDENNHNSRCLEYEVNRENYIKEKLDCTFIRYNPDDTNFNVLDVIGKIFSVILEQNDLLEE